MFSVYKKKKRLIELVSKNEINSLHGNRDDLISFLPSGFVLHDFFVYFEHLSETHSKVMTFKCSYQIHINRNGIEMRRLDSRFHPVLLCLFHVI
jgi:glycosylphosphatidylinositol transamidase (GPIT) subunit GPI8